MRQRQLARRESGFTLVEIAIVLVIIGLLLGGILKGQEMITQARIKNLANDFNGLTSAYFSYQDRYKAIPGDDQQANLRWPAGTYPGIAAGNGDGVMGGTYNAAAPGGESNQFWMHMRIAGFVPGPTANNPALTQPTNSVGGMLGVEDSRMGLQGLTICSANIPDKIAGPLDTQLDDQTPNTGSLRAIVQPVGPGNPAAPAAAPAAGPYTELGNQLYLMCKTI